MNPSASTPMCSFRQSRRFFDALCLCAFHSVPARECGVVRGLEVEAHQAEQRVQEPLGLAERQAEDDPQRQRGPDREVRVPPLASAKTVLRWYPRGNCILAQPDRDVAAAPEATLVLLQFRILYFVLYWRLPRLDCAATMTLPPDLYDGLDPTPAASVLAYTDSCTNATDSCRASQTAQLPSSTRSPVDLAAVRSRWAPR